MKINYQGNQQHSDRSNLEQYSKLYNCLLVNKKQKINSLDSLIVCYQKLQGQSTQLQSKNQNNSLTNVDYQFQTLYQDTSLTLQKEMQIKKNLWKQIIQQKKSLSLLKGDIGHLVDRNQSAKLLQSKITKVKIVADDQLKRVFLAFTKDKQQLKIRNQMQKNFNFKLKNMSMFQDISLNRMKKNYIELMNRRKDINDRLAQIEKVSSSIHQYGDLEKQKNIKNYQTFQIYNRLASLCQLISNNSKYKQNQNSMSTIVYLKQQFFKISYNTHPISDCSSYNSQYVANITDDALNNIQNQLISQFKKLKSQIYHKCCLYNSIIIQIQQSLSIYERLCKQIQQIKEKLQIQSGEQYQESGQSKVVYYNKLKLLRDNLKVIFKILSYFYISSQNQIQNNYVSKLHEFYMFFLKDTQKSDCNEICINKPFELAEIEIKSQQCYNNLQKDLCIWLKRATNQNKYKKNHEALRFSSFVKNICFLNPNKSSKIDEQSQQLEVDKNITENNQSQNYNQTNSLLIVHQATSSLNSICRGKQSITPIHSIYKKNSQSTYIKNSYQQVKAQRIQYLQNIDQDYYKMLKNTLKMQKQNTRKNYEFMRTFKRTKYANRDQILDEKRFQSSFSVLLTNTQPKPNKFIKENKQKMIENKWTPRPLSNFAMKRKSMENQKIKEIKNNQIKLNKKLKQVLDLTQFK